MNLESLVANRDYTVVADSEPLILVAGHMRQLPREFSQARLSPTT